ncbi:MAG: Omp28-related outer membrane protein [Crocinitomicaceae bacterium]|nr:Omp28-related outer membrane protein [Crocinitomicaceae bacterium]
MKKIYFFGVASVLSAAAFSQSMNENFDTYTAGSYMGNNSAAWTTWSGTVGGAEDCQISTTQAFSGTNSIYFVGNTAGGGPQDVIVPFGGVHTTGQFVFEAKFYVVTNKGAYFNFQGTNVEGQIWSLNCQMVQTGQLVLDDSYGNSITTTYPTAAWFTLTIDVNLNTNDWELLIDGVSQGVIQNTNNQVASIDIFPVNASYGGNNQSGFYIDDFTYNHTPYVLPTLNGAVTSITNMQGIVGINVQPTVTVRNLGTSPITSFDLTVDYNGTQLVENITGVNIASLASYDVTFASALTLVGGTLPVVATVSNVNGGGADDDAADDVKTIETTPSVAAPGKVVVAEEGTGTWCQWCPRGAVFMDMMSDKYDGYFAPIAVHNNDPMTVASYDAAIGPLLSGYPGAIVDRLPVIDPSAIETDFLSQIVIAPKAFVTASATYDSGTSLLTIEVSADFQQAVTGNYRLACVVTEDGVTGTGSGWSQSNAYAGGGNGEMGGYELLPSPVPASQMVYDHVARTILPSFTGQSGSVPTSVANGEVHSYTFSVTVDPSWDFNELNIVPMLINPAGDIENAGFYPIATLVGVEEETMKTDVVIYPNPASDMANLKIGSVDNETVIVRVYDINGRLITEKNYGMLQGEVVLPIATSLMNSGVYMVQVTVGESQTNTRLVVE